MLKMSILKLKKRVESCVFYVIFVPMLMAYLGIRGSTAFVLLTSKNGSDTWPTE